MKKVLLPWSNLLSLALVGVILWMEPAQAAVTSGPEFDTLVAIYDNAGGPNWYNELENKQVWKVGDACTWFGLTCNAAGDHIDVIDIYNNNLVGTLPDLSGLTQISNIHIEGNQIAQFPPGVSALGELRSFVMSNNGMQGSLPILSALQKLEHFDIASNQLSQSLPDLTGLGALKYFDVSYNSFSGPLPSGLGGLQNLEVFGASSNHFDSLSDFSGAQLRIPAKPGRHSGACRAGDVKRFGYFRCD